MAAMRQCLHRAVVNTRHCLTGLGKIASYGVQSSYNETGQLLVGISTAPQIAIYRHSHTFLSRTTAEQLWKGVTSVSAAGKRKGRGKRIGRKIAVDLNKGQVIGFGKKGMVWPGLNAPVVRGREVVAQRELPDDQDREKRIMEMRDQMSAFKVYRVHPLERGWSGTRLPGRSLGPPDPIGEETFEGFDSRVLEFKPVASMSGLKGRVRRLSALVVVGNKNGLAGFAVAKSKVGNDAAHSAKNRAVKNLRYIERYKEHTILHDFHASFGGLNVFAKRKPEGYGLMCHRAVKAICEMVGIKDMYARLEGNTKNYQNLTKAFFIGLMRQKTPQQLAEEKGLHVIELRRERDYFPEVIASPTRCRTEDEIPPDEILDYKLYLHDGKVQEYIKPHKPFYHTFPSYLKRMKEMGRYRNRDATRIQLLVRYGALKSFLTIREEMKEKEAVKDAVEAES